MTHFSGCKLSGLNLTVRDIKGKYTFGAASFFVLFFNVSLQTPEYPAWLGHFQKSGHQGSKIRPACMIL